MPFTPEELAASPNPLAAHYTRFRVEERLLLTGHSHQAWPDRGLLGQERAWEDAAELVDLKWERAFEQAERVRRGLRRLLDDPSGLSIGGLPHRSTRYVPGWVSSLTGVHNTRSTSPVWATSSGRRSRTATTGTM
jgi:hypothetical protein